MITAAASTLPGILPLPRTRLIGREGESAAARTLLLEEAVPLLSLTGAGGVGKTRLALAIAAEIAASFSASFSAGVVWIDFTPLTDPSLVPATVADALGITPTPDRAVADDLVRDFRRRQILLLLDSCAHVLAESAILSGHLLTRCPALQILATSRAPLHLRGEQVRIPIQFSQLSILDELTADLIGSIVLFTSWARATARVY